MGAPFVKEEANAFLDQSRRRRRRRRRGGWRRRWRRGVYGKVSSKSYESQVKS
jgi:hypothetical protein